MDKESLINAYFEGGLDENGLAEVARLRATDAEFEEELVFQMELQGALKKQERQEIKELFESLGKEEPSRPVKVFKLRPWLAAASIALVLGLGSWLFFNTGAMDPNQLYEANFEPYDNVVHPIERGNQIDDLKDRAFIAYENDEYALALELFSELNQEQNDPYIEFYSAIVHMQLGNHNKAVVALQSYMAQDGALGDRANWYLALSYLKLGELEKSKEQLRKVIANKTFKADAATNILDALE